MSLDNVWIYNPSGHAIKLPQLSNVAQICQTDDIAAIQNDYFLSLSESGYYQLCDKRLRHQPLTIDFSKPYYRFRGGTEWLPRALKGLAHASVADVTAGWGRDSWLLAYRGFDVVMFERNPYLLVLLEQGLTIARHNPILAEVAMRLSLQAGDAKVVLNKAEWPVFDVIYLDPMYPNRHKKAKVKKDMQALQNLLGGEENDGPSLLNTALEKAKQRVVVKRPKNAAAISPSILNVSPDYCIEAPNTRFDVYLRQK